MQKFVSSGATHLLGLTLALTSIGASAQTDADAQTDSDRGVIARHPVASTAIAGTAIVGAFVTHRVLRAPKAAPVEESYTYQPRPIPEFELPPETPEAIKRAEADTARAEAARAAKAATAAEQLKAEEAAAVAATPVEFPPVVETTTEPVRSFVAGVEGDGMLVASEFGLPSALGFVKEDGYMLRADADVPVKVTSETNHREYAVVAHPTVADTVLLVPIAPRMTHDSHIHTRDSVFAAKELTPERLVELDPTAILQAAAAASVEATGTVQP